MMIMTLMKQRHNFPVQDLAYIFDIFCSTSSRVFLRMLDILYHRTVTMIRCPTREALRKIMPMCFRVHYGDKVAVILDCFEVFVERSTNLEAQTKTWSSYKHHNTVKFLIGISPQGSISYISKAWRGRTSDKHITEHCGILDKILPGDYVMADRGFDIAETLALRGSRLIVPASMKGKNN